MTDLKTIIEDGVLQLQAVRNKSLLASTVPTSLPVGNYQLWQKRAELCNALKSTLELLPIRDESWLVVNSLLNENNKVDSDNTKVIFCSQKMLFAIARHMALGSYITTNWSVYDRLSNICGRLLGPEDIGNNISSKSNPKLLDSFMRNSKDKIRPNGFSLSYLLPAAYGWPASVSYCIRNWLVHDGLEVEGVTLFKGNSVSDAFELSSAAMDRIQKVCDNEGFPHSKCCFSTEPNHPWYDKSLLTILDKCHTEVDELFCSLLKWSISSFEMQVDLFSMRDRALIISSTTTTTTAP